MSLWGSRDRVQEKPKFANTANSKMYANTYGVTDTEAVHASTKVGGIHAGWVTVRAYKDCNNNLRYKAETLVAQSSMDQDVAYTANRFDTQTGTVTTVANSDVVTGNNTLFTTTVANGDIIQIDTSSPLTKTILSIANNTSLTLTATAGTAKSNKVWKKKVEVANTHTSTDDTDSNTFFQGA